MADDYFLRAQRHSRVADGKNWVTFAGALYAGTTFLLNPSGLNEGEVTDLRETAVGVAALQLTNQVYNPIQSRDNNLRAYHAYSCVAETTHLALERDVYVRYASNVLRAMRTDVEALQQLVDGGDLSEDVRTRAAEATTTARAELVRADQQVFAYYNFPGAVVRARDSIHEAFITANLRSELNFATLVQSMSSTVEANLAFLNKETPPTEEPQTGPDVASDNDDAEAEEKISALNDQVTVSQRITPNITTLSANLGQCAAVMTTGVRPSVPLLSDIGPGLLPKQTDPFFPPERVSPTSDLLP